MGGGVALKAVTVDPRIKAAVLYAPVSADDADLLARWGIGCRGGQSEHEVVECAGAEILTNTIDESLLLAYLETASDPELLRSVSAIHHFGYVVAPVQIHVGTADSTTPLEWSETMREALQSAGKEVEYYAYPGQGHTFEGEPWQLFMGRVADFFDRHLASDS
jgi:dipeptidyl aminopeptidase/acylaminoacyl peptidase